MPGLITAGILGGLGAGLGKYEEQQEKERAAEAENERAIGRAKYSAELQKEQTEFQGKKNQELKIAEEERARAKMKEFEVVARDWKAANPDAKFTDFVNHFSTTEYGPLLKPMIEAAGLEKQTQMYERGIKESEARMGLIEKQIKSLESSDINKRIEAAQPGGKGSGKGGGGGAKGGGSTAEGNEDRLDEKDYNKVHRDAQAANPIYDTSKPVIGTEKPPLDMQAMGLQGKLMRQLYNYHGNTALAEQQAVDVMRSAVEFANEQRDKAPGKKVSASQWQRLLDEGAQRRLNELDKEEREAKAAREKNAKDAAEAAERDSRQWGGEGKGRAGVVESPTYGVTGTWPENTGGAGGTY